MVSKFLLSRVISSASKNPAPTLRLKLTRNQLTESHSPCSKKLTSTVTMPTRFIVSCADTAVCTILPTTKRVQFRGISQNSWWIATAKLLNTIHRLQLPWASCQTSRECFESVPNSLSDHLMHLMQQATRCSLPSFDSHLGKPWIRSEKRRLIVERTFARKLEAVLTLPISQWERLLVTQSQLSQIVNSFS